jgi:HEAT repeat protein
MLRHVRLPGIRSCEEAHDASTPGTWQSIRVSDDSPVAQLVRLRGTPEATPIDICRAIHVVRDAGLHDAAPALRAFLRDTDATVVWSACQALGTLRARDAIADLIDLLRPEAAAERRIDCAVDPFGAYVEYPAESAIEGLSLMGAVEAIPDLVKCLQAERDGTRLAAVKALARLGASHMTTQVAGLRADRDPAVRAAAGEFLRRFGDGP